MNSGICPKCQSSNVFKKGVNYDKGVYVYTGIVTSVSPYISYVCANCGYFENYIDDQAKLADVASKWESGHLAVCRRELLPSAPNV